MKEQNRLNILVIGTGMYVLGRGTDAYGTIMPAIMEWSRQGELGHIYLAGTNPDGIRSAKNKMNELTGKMGMEISVKYFPGGHNIDPKAYKEAIRKVPRPAVCIVSVPDRLHSQIAKEAIDQGLHTLVVKPLAPTVKEVEALIRAQENKGVWCAVEFHKRLDLANLKMKDEILRGSIGRVLYFIVEYSQRKSVPSEKFRKWVMTTNIFQYLGMHYVDMIYFMTGACPLRAIAIGQKGHLKSLGIDTYDSIQALIEWKIPGGNTFTSSILTNWIDPENTSAMSDQKIKVIGTKGRFESDQKDRGISLVTDEKGPEKPNPYFCSAYGVTGKVSYCGYGIDSIRQFLDDVMNIRAGKVKIDDLEKTRPSFKQSIVPTRVLEAVNESLKNGGEWVNIKNQRPKTKDKRPKTKVVIPTKVGI